jgi:hypothetical protein
LAAARFEGVFATRSFPQVRARTTGLLLGSWLSLTALAAASLAAALLSLRAGLSGDAASSWLGARESARASWSCSLPIAAALLAVFIGRLRESGLFSLERREFVWAVVALALPATLAFGQLKRASGNAEWVATPAALSRAPTSPRTALSSPPEPSPEPSPTARASATTPASPDGKDPNSDVGVEVSVAEGVYEEDARRNILRRIERAHECMRRDPSAHGILSLRVVVDADGSVTNVVPLSGDLLGSAFAKCAMLWLYRVGFASLRSHEIAKFEVTLHFPGGEAEP